MRPYPGKIDLTVPMLLRGRAFRSLLVSTLLLFGLRGIAGAQAYNWQNVVMMGGGFVPGLVYSPLQQNLLYARTDVGGFYRWDNTNSRWIPLTDMYRGNNFGGESIAPDPVNANIVYAAAGFSGPGTILSSTNQGNSWTANAIPVSIAGNNDGREAGERLAVDPNLNSKLYFGSRWQGLWVSANSAASWSQVTAFPVNGDAGYGLAWVIFPPPTGGDGHVLRQQQCLSLDQRGRKLVAHFGWPLQHGHPPRQFGNRREPLDRLRQRRLRSQRRFGWSNLEAQYRHPDLDQRDPLHRALQRLWGIQRNQRGRPEFQPRAGHDHRLVERARQGLLDLQWRRIVVGRRTARFRLLGLQRQRRRLYLWMRQPLFPGRDGLGGLRGHRPLQFQQRRLYLRRPSGGRRALEQYQRPVVPRLLDLHGLRAGRKRAPLHEPRGGGRRPVLLFG